VVLLVALVLTVLAFYYVGRNVEAREQQRFEEITGSAERAVDRRMQTYIDAMLDPRGLFAARRCRGTSSACFAPTTSSRGSSASSPTPRWTSKSSTAPGCLGLYPVLSASEQQKERALKGGYLPTRKDCYEDGEILSRVSVIELGREAIRDVRSRPVTPLYHDMSLAMAEQFHAALAGMVAPERAGATFRERLQEILERSDSL
jgi:hypothetical protein